VVEQLDGAAEPLRSVKQVEKLSFKL
jgi:hypothetical protein